MVSSETLNTTEQFFCNTEKDPINPRLLVIERLIELGYGLRIDPVARQSRVYGANSAVSHVAIYGSGNAYEAFYRVTQCPEFDVLLKAYDLRTYVGSVPQMGRCNWSDQMKKKVAAWAMKNTAARFSAMVANVDTNPWYKGASDEKKDQVRERCAREAEDAKKEAYMLGGLVPAPALSLLELESLVRNSVRQTLPPSN